VFDWSPVASAVQYQLQVDNSANFSSPEMDVVVHISAFAPVSNLPDDSYTWRVRAKDDNGNWGDWSEMWTITIETNQFIYLPVLINRPQ
jgi:hypothetical protein